MTGARTAGDILLSGRFAELGLGRTLRHDGWLARRNRTRHRPPRRLAEARPREPAVFYACGPDGMLRAVGDRAIAREEPTEAWLSLDKHMVCGVGACLACVQELRSRDGTTRLGARLQRRPRLRIPRNRLEPSMSDDAPDLRVNLGGLAMANPVTVASGTFGYGLEYAELVDVRRLGAITVKGIRLAPWPGNPLPRHVEVRGGMVNAIGLQGPGVKGFIEHHLPPLRALGVPVIVNIWGDSADEYAEVARRLSDAEGVSALEMNLSCPNVKAGGAAFGTDPATMAAVVSATRPATRLPSS
jgi:hypothetical protein